MMAQPTSTKKSRLIFASVMTLIFLVFYFHKDIFFSHQIELTVLEKGLPRTCYTGWGNRFLNEDFRSSNPTYYTGNYCGAVRTNKGLFELVESSVFFKEGKREAIFDELELNQTYLVKAVGYSYASDNPAKNLAITKVLDSE